MRARPDGHVGSISRAIQSLRTTKNYGSFSLGEGWSISVARRRYGDEDILDLRLTLGGQPMRRGLTLFPEEVGVIAALLQRAARDFERPSDRPTISAKGP